MIDCPHCHAPNRATARFCNTCGKPVTLPEIPAPLRVDTPPAPIEAEFTAVMSDGETVSNAPNAMPTTDVEPALTAPALHTDAVSVSENGALQNEDGSDLLAPANGSVAQTENGIEIKTNDPVMAAASEPIQIDPPVIESSGDPTAKDMNPQTLNPLLIGAALEKRFTILELVAPTADSNTYRARDAWRCPTCEFENEADAVFCANCGRELGEGGTVLLIERAAPKTPTSIEIETPPATEFLVGERVYEIQNIPPPPPLPDAPAQIQLQYAVASDAGVVRGSAREANEDSAFALALSAMHESQAHPTLGLFIVADGIGGSAAGELASKKAIQTLSTLLLQSVLAPLLGGGDLEEDAIRASVSNAVEQANARVKELAAEKHNDMGTTVTLALVRDDVAYIANVGDSRAYLLRGGALQPITRDHSLVMDLVEANMITRDEIYTHPQRNIILRSLGSDAPPEVDLFPREGGGLKLQKGDRLLLCSDGLWEMVRDFDLESLLLRETDLQKAAAHLIAAANEGGGEDNVTLILVGVN